MTAATRTRIGAIVPWLALGLSLIGALTSIGITWGRTERRVEAMEDALSEHRALIRSEISTMDDRLRAVEGTTRMIPGMAQDIRDIRVYMLEHPYTSPGGMAR